MKSVNSKNIMIISLLFVLILCIGAASAADTNTTISSDDITSLADEDAQLDASQDENTSFGGENAKLADSLTVTGTDFNNIQTTINSAQPGATIFLDGKTYTGLTPIKVNKNNLTIIGGSQSNPDGISILNGQEQTSIMSIAGNNVTIKGIKFINGNTTGYGGAINWHGADGTVSDCIFENNYAAHGGAIYWHDVVLSNHGGAWFADDANGKLINSNFTNNKAIGPSSTGGAVRWHGENGTLSGCIFYNNSAGLHGGAVNWNGADGTLSECNFTDNTAGESGGGIQWSGNNGAIKSSDFANNTAKIGGAIFSTGDGMTIEGNTFKDSEAVLAGFDFYAEWPKTMNISVKNSKIPPQTKILSNSDVSVIYSGSAVYKVLITKDGKVVGAGESVTINFNGANTVVKTDANGYATYNINTNIKVGTYTIKATYYGSTVTNTVKIAQLIKAPNKKVKKSKKVTKVKITLAKVDGKILKGKILKIKFNKKTYKVKTNKKGVAVWKVKKSMLKKLKAGKKYKYTVTYGKATLTKKLIIKK